MRLIDADALLKKLDKHRFRDTFSYDGTLAQHDTFMWTKADLCKIVSEAPTVVVPSGGKPKPLKVLKMSDLRTFDGIVYIEDRDWVVLRGLANTESERSWYFNTWVLSGKMSHDERMIHTFFKKDYGKTWRCWSAQPTDEQMEAEPWK